MRVLFVSPAPPRPLTTGTRVRLNHLMKGLSRRGHELGLVALAYQGDVEAMKDCDISFRDLCLLRIRRKGEGRPSLRQMGMRRLWRVLRLLLGGIPPRLALTYRPDVEAEILRRVPDYDVVFVEVSFMALNLHPSLWKREPNPLILVEHDISFIPLKRRAAVLKGRARLGATLTWWGWRRLELHFLRRFPRVVLMSRHDRALLAEVVNRDPRDLWVVPNGVDCEAVPFLPARPAPGHPPVLLFLGGMAHGPNHDGLSWFLREHLPLLLADHPGLSLRVVGDPDGKAEELLGLAPPGAVTFLGFVEDPAESFSTATALVVPLRIGGGTRVKILHAMAAGLPVITTRTGAEGLELEADRHCLLAENPREFASALRRLLTEPALAGTLAREARALCDTRYQWDAIAEDLHHLLQTMPGRGTT